ncbi:unnamed protein product [Closterium sp. NIES-53]
MCVPSPRHNLVAQTEVQDAGLRTVFSENEDHCDIIDPLTNKILARFTLNSSGLYTLRVPLPQVSTTQAQATITPCPCRSLSNPTILYHHQLGHPNFRTLADMASKKLLLGLPAALPPPPDSPAPTCLDCTKSKLRQQPHPASPTVAAAPLDLVHMDVWGPAPVPARGGHRYFLAIVDDHSRYDSVHLLHTKAEAPEVIMASLGASSAIPTLHSLSGGKPSTMPPSFIIFTPIRIFPTPLGKTPTARSLRVWGCTAYVLLNPQARRQRGGKLGPKTQTCIYLGHNADSRDYLFLNPSTQQLVRSRDVVFDELRPFYSTSGLDPPSDPPSLVWADFDAHPDPPPASAPSPPPSPAIAPSPSEISDPTSPVSSAAAPPSPSPPTLPTVLPPPSAPITYHRRSHPPAPHPPPVPPTTEEPALPQSPELITYHRRSIPPPKPPKQGAKKRPKY